jgi:hypothetical protein
VALLALIIALSVTRPNPTPSDSARIANGRLIIEPLGSSFEIPPTWLEPQPKGYGAGQDCETHSPLSSRTHISRESLQQLSNATGPWDKEFSNVVDSVLPFASTVAQVGAEGWGAESKCFGDLQVRVYVSELAVDSIARQVRTRGQQTANRFFPTKATEEADSLGWRIQKLQWDAFYYDYGAPTYVEFLSRRIGTKTLTLVLMYSIGRKPELDREIILSSFREHS